MPVLTPLQVMAYDLMNRRDTETTHHSGIEGSKKAVDLYIERGMDASKLILGFAFYAKWFTTQQGVQCTGPTGCPTAVLEAADGSDTGLSGAVTFEIENFSNQDLVNALANGQEDAELGGQWYWDAAKSVYWTWDTPALVARKFDEIVKAKGLGGAMAWSLAQDSHDWSLFKAMQTGIAGLQ
jgi:chitinase